MTDSLADERERVARIIDADCFALPRINLYRERYKRAYAKADAILAALRRPIEPVEAVAWRVTDGEGDYDYLTDEPSESTRAWSARYGRKFEPLYASPPTPQETRRAPFVSIKPMQLSDGRTDYFVSIKVGDREVTPHVFREEFKAAYHVALYDWLLNGSGEEPDVVEFGPDDWPALSTSPAPAGDVPSYNFPYQQTFDAIAAAVTRHPTSLGISVKAFQETFNSHRDKCSLTSADQKQAMQDGGWK